MKFRIHSPNIAGEVELVVKHCSCYSMVWISSSDVAEQDEFPAQPYYDVSPRLLQ